MENSVAENQECKMDSHSASVSLASSLSDTEDEFESETEAESDLNSESDEDMGQLFVKFWTKHNFSK